MGLLDVPRHLNAHARSPSTLPAATALAFRLRVSRTPIDRSSLTGSASAAAERRTFSLPRRNRPRRVWQDERRGFRWSYRSLVATPRTTPTPRRATPRSLQDESWRAGARPRSRSLVSLQPENDAGARHPEQIAERQYVAGIVRREVRNNDCGQHHGTADQNRPAARDQADRDHREPVHQQVERSLRPGGEDSPPSDLNDERDDPGQIEDGEYMPIDQAALPFDCRQAYRPPDHQPDGHDQDRREEREQPLRRVFNVDELGDDVHACAGHAPDEERVRA